MGFFNKKSDHTSLGEAAALGVDPRELAKMSRKEREQLQNKVAGKVKRSADMKAGLSDLKNGRGSNRTSTPPPPVRKGRSMFGPDTPLKKGK